MELGLRAELNQQVLEQVRYRTREGMKTVAKHGRAPDGIRYGYRVKRAFDDDDIDNLASDHFMGDAGETGNVGRDRTRRLLKTAIDAGDIANLTGTIEGVTTRISVPVQP